MAEPQNGVVEVVQPPDLAVEVVQEGSLAVEILSEDAIIDIVSGDIDPTDVIEVLSEGPEGPPGPAGQAFVHTQAVPASEWVINHNLGTRPAIVTLTTGGIEVFGDVLHASLNQARVTFVAPLAGFARCV
jgi:hypothetical protein